METVNLTQFSVMDIVGTHIIDMEMCGDFSTDCTPTMDSWLQYIAQFEAKYLIDSDAELFVWASTRCGYVAPFVKEALLADEGNEKALVKGLTKAYGNYLYNYLTFNYKEVLYEACLAYLRSVGIKNLIKVDDDCLKKAIENTVMDDIFTYSLSELVELIVKANIDRKSYSTARVRDWW